MPLGPGVRYRWVKRGGKMIRLAFRGKEVIEVKKKGGKAHRVTKVRKNSPTKAGFVRRDDDVQDVNKGMVGVARAK